MDESGILSEILEEYLNRLHRGECPDPEEYVQRYPAAAQRIRELLATAGLVQTAIPTSADSRVPLSSNPYLSRLMIEEPSSFFGREHELGRIFSRIGSPRPQSVSVVGERRIGKSSLLNALTWPETRRRFLSEPDPLILIFIDFQQLPGISRNGFLDLLLKKMREHVDLGTLPGEENRYLLLQAALDQISRQRRSLIFLFDEFDSVTSNPSFGPDFFSFLRSCANNCAVGYVTSSRSDLQELCHSSSIADSPFFNIFSSLYLKTFTLAEAEQLIEQPSSAAGVPLKDYQSELLALAGKFPFYLQIACSVYFESLASRSRDSRAGRQEAFLEEALPHFRYFWDHCRPEELEVLQKLASGRQPEPDQLFWGKRLEKSGYVVRRESRFQLFSQAFAAQIKVLEEFANAGISSPSPRIQEASWELAVGQQIQQYQVVGELGRGGMGIVYAAEDRGLLRKVVLKLCRPGGHSQKTRQRALQEARTAAALRHPGIAGVHELLDYHGVPVIVMEWVDGSNLAELLSRDGPLSWRPLCSWMVQCCDALEYAHEQGLVHRDIKPSNLMISREGKLKLTDFGLAKWSPEQDSAGQLTASGGILGTLNYLSPEQARGAPLDLRSDLFSLAVLCFEALTGKLPFQRPDLPTTLQAILHDPMPSLSLYGVENASVMDAIIRKLGAKRPADRFQSAREARGQFLQALSGSRGWFSRIRPPWTDSSEDG